MTVRLLVARYMVVVYSVDGYNVLNINWLVTEILFENNVVSANVF